MNQQLKIEKVVRIIYCRYRAVKAVVDYRYFINGSGPFDIHGNTYKEPPKDSRTKKILWTMFGYTTPGAR